MRRNNKFFKARHDMAISISERLFAKCDQLASKKPAPHQETIEDFINRDGKIKVIPPERR